MLEGVAGRGRGSWVWGEERRGGVARRSVNGDESFLCMVVAFRVIRDESGNTHTKLSHSLSWSIMECR